MYRWIIILIYSITTSVYGQSDTLHFSNGNILVGEIKGMQKGVLEIDADYGDEVFRIRWLDVKEIYSGSTFLVRVGNKIVTGKIASLPDQNLKIYEGDSTWIQTALADVVYIRPFKSVFTDRFHAAVELGFNMLGAQNLRQFSNRNTIGYRNEKWILDATYNSLRSFQENSLTIVRHDGQINYQYLLPKTWYLIGTYSILSNTEQRLDLRMNTQLGVGKFLYSTNKMFWSFKIGGNNNNEKFTAEESARNSWEGYFGTVLSLYDIGDLECYAEYIGYTGLQVSRRYRSDSSVEVKYDLPFDFFIRIGFTLNYDNQPAANGDNISYIVRSGIGWEW